MITFKFSHTITKLFLGLIFSIVFVRFFQNRLDLSDLQVYFGACRSFLSNANPYLAPYGLGSGFYKYSPFFLILFSPLAALPWTILQFIFPILSILTFYLFFKNLKTLLIEQLSISSNKDLFNLENALILNIFLQAHNIYREILIGNINIFLMTLILYFINCYIKRKSFISALILSTILLIKPHFILFIPLLFFYKSYKIILLTCGYSVFFLLLPAFFIGFENCRQLLTNWIQAMNSHNHAMGYVENNINIQHILWQVSSLFKSDFIENHLKLCINFTIFCSSAILFSYLFLNRNLFLAKTKYFSLFIFAILAMVPFILLVDSNQLIYIFPFTVYLFYGALKSNYRKHKVNIIAGAIYIFTICTQQIPSDWISLNKFIGGAYILLLIIFYLIKKQQNLPNLSDPVH